jgi:hypothetical protein
MSEYEYNDEYIEEVMDIVGRIEEIIDSYGEYEPLDFNDEDGY